LFAAAAAVAGMLATTTSITPAAAVPAVSRAATGHTLTGFKYVPCHFGYAPGFAMGYHDHMSSGGTGDDAANNNNNNANNNNIANNNNNHVTITLPPVSRHASGGGGGGGDDGGAAYRRGYTHGRAFGIRFEARLAGDGVGDSAKGRAAPAADTAPAEALSTTARVAGVQERKGWCWVKVQWEQTV